MQNCYYRKLSPYKLAISDLCDYYNKGMLITRINVPKEFRGKGVGSEILKDIIRDSDKDKIVLFLEIQPSDGLNFKQLEDWYIRYGFKYWKGILRRIPKEDYACKV
jgi:hypothetical protein